MKYCIISDIHSNLHALESILNDAKTFMPEKYICLGDCIGYGVFVNETISRIRNVCDYVIPGNHDWGVIDKINTSNFNPNAIEAVVYSRKVISPENYEYLGTLSPTMSFDNFQIAHGSMTNPLTDYITNSITASINFKYIYKPVCFIGHTHIPIIFQYNPETGSVEVFNFSENKTFRLDITKYKYIINSGSVGQPRDKNPYASYLIFDNSEMKVENRRVAYDIESAKKSIINAGLPHKLGERLEFGR
ncbi:metallophosphoesterase family protein [Candidatus Dependentiae bacterium]|nr:metallophosphoesterase family protein [Candidatus Dependentiae bacterium]